MNRVARGSAVAPQFARGETNRVHVLTLLALEVRVGVRENVNAVIARDDALLASSITWEPRVPRRVHVAGADVLANFELSHNPGILDRRNVAPKTLSRDGCSETRRRLCRAWFGHTGFEFALRDQAVLHSELLVDPQPALVISQAKVVG